MNAGEANKLTTTACHATKPAPAAKRIKAISITTERTGETLWDDNAPKATVTIVTSWIQARRGQSTCFCSRIRL